MPMTMATSRSAGFSTMPAGRGEVSRQGRWVLSGRLGWHAAGWLGQRVCREQGLQLQQGQHRVLAGPAQLAQRQATPSLTLLNDAAALGEAGKHKHKHEHEPRPAPAPAPPFGPAPHPRQ